ncbi:hypothetical protein SAMN02799620_04812 [Mycolicibacterium fluoranthenivorans]|uniref:Uncharacterized protein n=1 Tax=Mycolicibacterium fluoranthenivorans TaxID=258505 RepID=A0A1G4WTZ6_9MYCO|nr:hypothetical protein SAMN02799620_04812 [Mycolicibacterium fluoranthenivorans]
MAITRVGEYAHLSNTDLEAFAVALEAIRHDIEDSLRAKGRAYIQCTIAFQCCLEVGARVVITRSRSKAS